MKKRVISVLLLTAMIVLSLVGCGDTQEAMGSAESTESVADGASGEKEISIISSENLSEAQKQEEVDTMVEMTAIAEKEAAAEILLEAKGFKDIVVSINSDTVYVTVNATELDEDTRTQIEDIVARKTEIPVEHIVIRTGEDEGDIPALEPDVANTDALYMPGTYSSELVLGENVIIDVEVIVDKDNLITSIQMVNLDESYTMYPLLVPTFDSICEQIYEQQSLENITYTADNKYTSLMLLDAIQNSLNQAKKE